MFISYIDKVRNCPSKYILSKLHVPNRALPCTLTDACKRPIPNLNMAVISQSWQEKSQFHSKHPPPKKEKQQTSNYTPNNGILQDIYVNWITCVGQKRTYFTGNFV